MIRKSDVKWWVLEARKHPESVPRIVEELVKRLVDLDEQNETLRNRVVQMQQRRSPVESSSAQVESLKRQVDVLKSMVEGESDTENMILFLSEEFQSARTSVSRIQQLSRAGHGVFDKRNLIDLCALLSARPHDELLVLTNHAHGFKSLVTDVAPLIDETQWPAVHQRALDVGERITLATVVSDPPRFWTTVTRQGYVQRFVRVAFDKQIADGASLPFSPFRNDPPIALVNGEQGEIVLITRWGEAVRFPQRTIAVNGSVATQLDPDDRFVAAVSLSEETELLIVTTSGYATRYSTEKLKALAKPGAKSRRILLARDVMAMIPCSSQSQLLYLTYSGKMLFVPTDKIQLQARAGKGMQLPHMGKDPILAVTLVPNDWL